MKDKRRLEGELSRLKKWMACAKTLWDDKIKTDKLKGQCGWN